MDEVAVPDGLEERVREAEEDPVLHRVLAEVVVDAEDARLVEAGEEDPVELAGRREIAARVSSALLPGRLRPYQRASDELGTARVLRSGDVRSVSWKQAVAAEWAAGYELAWMLPAQAIERREIELHGQRFAYCTAGSGPLIVLLHGIAQSSATWDAVIPRLIGQHAVIAPDLLGHGHSAKAPGDYSLGAYTNLVRDLLEALGQNRCTMVGHSLGGGVAMQFSYQFPERCERLVLVSSGGLGREIHPILRAAALPGADVVLPWLSVAGARAMGTLVNALGRFGIRASTDLGETWRSFAALEEPSARKAFLQTVRGLIDLGGQRISATDRLYLAAALPTMIIWGEQDPLIPVAHALRAHDAIPSSRIEIFPGVGHYPHLDDPEHFARVLLDFIRTTQPQPADAARLRDRLRAGPRVPSMQSTQ